MTSTIDHRPAEEHHHTHGPGCGHEAVVHQDHVDYLHDGNMHHEHSTTGGVHYDVCTRCTCGNCTDSCAQCSCSDCSCSTCNHATCQCGNCSDSCSDCACSDCTCTTCNHAA